MPSYTAPSRETNVNFGKQKPDVVQGDRCAELGRPEWPSCVPLLSQAPKPRNHAGCVDSRNAKTRSLRRKAGFLLLYRKQPALVTRAAWSINRT
jgi:hypothetical protein